MKLINNPFGIVLALPLLFAAGWLAGTGWNILGDKENLVNRYLEAHTSRFLNETPSHQIYYVFYEDFDALLAFTQSRASLDPAQQTSLKKLATVSIDKNTLPHSLDRLREKEFVRFIFPGTFPFICH